MAICEFCVETLCLQPKWFPNTTEVKQHHTLLAIWKESVKNGCTICTLLLEHLMDVSRSASECGARLY
jgi:hypothetical protein